MNTLEALKALGVTVHSMTDEQRASLDELGYFVIENALTPGQCETMAAEVDRIALQDRELGRHEVSSEAGTLRVSDVLNKSTAFDCLFECKPVLAAAHYLLGGEIKVHGANVREPHQGHGQQPIHADTLKLRDGGWCLINALIAFDPMTLENGPTRIIPGSHKWPPLNVPGENAVDYNAKPREQAHRWATPNDNIEEYIARDDSKVEFDRFPADPFAPYPGELKITVPAGAIVVLNAHMWHSGTRKNDESRRRVLFLTYTCRDLPQQFNQRQYATPTLYERVSEAHRYLLDID
jgi:ectoine hydroxylase-related dioxygenase (phytanoyl-CoA dioxygenase family)